MSPELKGLLYLVLNQASKVRAAKLTVAEEKALKVNTAAAKDLLEKEFPADEPVISEEEKETLAPEQD